MLQYSFSFSSESKPLHISLSNFDHKKKDHLQVLIQKLGGIYDENLEYGTNILVASNALSNKYKSATLLNIPIVISKWLYKSIENDGFLPIDDYRLPIFNDLKFGVLGFTTEEALKIKENCEKKEGKIINTINEIMVTQDLTLILVKSSEYKTYESFLKTLKTPVVSEEWYHLCLQRDVYVKPEQFLLGHKNVSISMSTQREIFQSEMKILSENKLRKCMKEIDASDTSYLFLEDCVIHFFNIEEGYDKILRDITNIGGGFYMNTFNVAVTHLITQDYQEEDLAKFRRFGTNFFVLHPLWLKDCFFYKKKVSEFEYFLMPGVNLRTISEEPNLRSRGLMKKPSFFQSEDINNSRFHRESVQIRNSQENKLPKNQAKKDTPKKTTSLSPFKKDLQIQIKSFLFMNQYFFINTSDFKDLRGYRQKILEHSGKIVDNLKNNKFPIFYVLSDGYSSLRIRAQKMDNVNYISFRWIDYCLEKKQIVKNYMDLKLIQLSPLNFKMPLECFKDSWMYVCGFPAQEKIVLRSLMTTMGIKISTYDKEKITHLVCESQKNKKYQEILELKKTGRRCPKIVKAEWIFNCLRAGKVEDETEFLF